MKTRKLALFIFAAVLSLGAHASEKRYLVQFKSPQAFKSVLQSMRTANPFSTSSTMTSMKLLNSNAVVGEAFEHLDMLVVETSDPAAISSLRQHPAIGLVEEEIFHPAPKPMATWGNQIQAQHTSKARMETPWGILAVKAPEAWTTTKGETARVMVLDTGLDVEHIALKGRYEKGRNFAGGSPDDLTDGIGHGSHVAGTILADGLNGALVGVAPEAKLLMGKVCTAMGCSSVAIAGGINWAIDEQVDVINMSLGGMFISHGEALALDRAEQAGVMVIAASGNSGTGSVSYPAAYRSVLAVGAVDSSLVKADFSQWGPQLGVVAPGVDVISSVPRGSGREASVQMDLADGKGLTDVKALPFVGSARGSNMSNELVFANLGKLADFATINVQGKFALISRGEIAFSEKVSNALQAGAVGVVIYNNVPGLLQGTLTEDGSEISAPVVMIEQTVGEQARAALAAGTPIVASMSVQASDYAAFQGTSMACPHVAGVAALVRAANKSLTPAQVRDLLKATATPLGPNLNNEYGAGIVNAQAAVQRALAMDVPAALRAAN